jgi:hypothetical protein
MSEANNLWHFIFVVFSYIILYHEFKPHFTGTGWETNIL